MRAMVLVERRAAPLVLRDVPMPEGEVVLRVECCAVCRTDLHVVDGELPEPKLPLIPGHQIVGRDVKTGERLGVPWLGWTCGECRYCLSGRENLCDRARFTGYTLDGGYAEYVAAGRRYCFPIPDEYSSSEAAPLLCAGMIGYRAYRMTGLGGEDAARPAGATPALHGTGRSAAVPAAGPAASPPPRPGRLGLYGFGSSARILAQVAKADGHEIHAFTRENAEEQRELDAAIIFAPVGDLVVNALKNVVKGGVVVCAGIHMSDIPSFPYSLLWGERIVRSVANLTREDGVLLFERLKTLRIETQRTAYPLERANEALDALRTGTLTGTAIIEITPGDRATGRPQ